MIILMPMLRFGFEIGLLFVMLYAGIREIAIWAIALIIFRLFLSLLNRIQTIPDLLEEFQNIVAGIIICILKIASEVAIFFAIKEDIYISTNIAITLIVLMTFRNISDTASLLAIELDEV